MKKIRILVADDHGIVRKGIALQLAQGEHFQLVGEAVDGREAVTFLIRVKECIEYPARMLVGL